MKPLTLIHVGRDGEVYRWFSCECQASFKFDNDHKVVMIWIISQTWIFTIQPYYILKHTLQQNAVPKRLDFLASLIFLSNLGILLSEMGSITTKHFEGDGVTSERS